MKWHTTNGTASLGGIFGGCGLNLGQPGEGDAKKGESAVGAAGPPHVSSGQGTSSSCFVIRKVKNIGECRQIWPSGCE